MWKISDLKTRGKATFQHNYWPFVAVTVVLSLLSGEITTIIQKYQENFISVLNGWGFSSLEQLIQTPSSPESLLVWSKDLFVLCVPLAASAGIVGLAISLLVTNPYEVGADRFYLESGPERSVSFSRVAWGFQANFGNVVLTQFLRALYTFLWSLLFLIPGVIRRYSYFAVPYILAENPHLDHNRVLKLSREMTKGYKWDIFLAQLSFLGWFILSTITMSIVGIFYVNPYYQGTMAEIYRWLRSNALHNGIASQDELPGLNGGYHTTL